VRDTEQPRRKRCDSMSISLRWELKPTHCSVEGGCGQAPARRPLSRCSVLGESCTTQLEFLLVRNVRIYVENWDLQYAYCKKSEVASRLLIDMTSCL